MIYKLFLVGILISQCSCRPTLDLFPYVEGFNKTLSSEAIDKCLQENPDVKRFDCEIKNCLASPITLLAMHELLINATEVFDELKVQYWVDGGSAIAAERFNAHLPWDDDVDLGVLSQDFDEEQQKLFAKKIYERGFELKALNGTPLVAGATGRQGVLQVAYRKARFFKLVLSVLPTIAGSDLDNLWLRYERGMSFLPHLDVFLFDEVSPGRYAYRSTHFRNLLRDEKSMPLAVLKGPKKIDILGKDFNAVQNLSEYGRVVYGTSDLVNDFYVSREHSEGCQKLRFKDIKKHPEILKYLISYLDFVYSLPAAKTMVKHYDSEKVLNRYGLK